MNNSDERDYAEEEYNRRTAEREEPAEYVIQGWYADQYRWEDLTVEDNPDDAAMMLHDYNVNEPDRRHRIDVRLLSEKND